MHQQRLSAFASQGLAIQLLNADINELEINAKKLRLGLPWSLRVCAATGKCTMKLYIVASQFAKHARDNVAYNEMTNKGIKLQGLRAPNVSLELISSRTTIKAELGYVMRLVKVSLSRSVEQRTVSSKSASSQYASTVIQLPTHTYHNS